MRRYILLFGLALALAVSPAWAGPIISSPDIRQAGQPCSQAVHDAITVTGPDGKKYPTWHGPVHSTGCYFGHEHGADPRTSKANATLPPFGYIGTLAGDNEPHVGFKVFIVHAGAVYDGKTARADSRVVFHMGTGGVARYTTRLHSMMYDYVARDGSGRSVSLQGMADTGTAVGSTCDRPRKNGRDFSTTGCNDDYEIWNFRFLAMHPSDPYVAVDQVRAAAVGNVAVFNPITTRMPTDNQRLIYTETYRNGPMASNPLSPLARYRGCEREIYDGPVYWNNTSNRPGAAAIYWSDVYGRINAAGQAPGLLQQKISMSPKTNLIAFKYRQDFCDATVRAPN